MNKRIAIFDAHVSFRVSNSYSKDKKIRQQNLRKNELENQNHVQQNLRKNELENQNHVQQNLRKNELENQNHVQQNLRKNELESQNSNKIK